MLNMVVVLILGGLLPALSSPLAQQVAEDVASANLIRRVNPVYSESARAAHVEGIVIFEAEINPEGAVTNVRVVSGHPLLTAAAMEAVRQWRYNPALLNNESKVITRIRVNVGPERAQIDCGPLPSVRLYETPSEEREVASVECGEEVVIVGRALAHVEVQTEGVAHASTSKRGWISSLYVSSKSGADGSSPGEKAAAAIDQAHLDCAKRATLNIYDVPGATTISRLACGETVSVLAMDDPYAKIRTRVGVEGWVLRESLDIHPK